MERDTDDMSGVIYNLGRQLGHRVVPAIRKTRWIWAHLTGSEEEARRAEQSFGAALAVELRAALEPVDDSEARSRVNNVCARIEDSLRPPHHAYHCSLIRADQANAIAIPGGFIFLSQSLYRLCEGNRDELAFVIGHEMAHIVRGHTWDRMLNQTALNAASAVAFRGGALGAWLRQKGMRLLQSGHSRESEKEADELALRLAVAAGFDSAGSISLLQRIQNLGPDPTLLGQYFASHPPAAERIARLRELRQGLPSRDRTRP